MKTILLILLAFSLTACGGGVAYEGDAQGLQVQAPPHVNNQPEPGSH